MSFHRSSSSRDRPLTAVSLAESAASLELHSAVTLLASKLRPLTLDNTEPTLGATALLAQPSEETLTHGLRVTCSGWVEPQGGGASTRSQQRNAIPIDLSRRS
jgi:hypothetical protein